MIREAIKREMSSQDISQQRIADHLGIGKSTLSNYLSGRRKISIENIEAILEFLGIELISIKKQP